ncbi:hypothetical protein [Halopelagius longus]|uniref:Small CPxCG-related zinc finger protein n=1 Tax=Halopelagius longus TaxID=1236180 RepID=A0A1H1C7L2_9EURY|nr:hypothetical protein [Halopelagius longus]RDI71087.1 hypothetical protein DWB78_04715 [Halopelagius longus]SDQ59666.1 hypothetical protein SAMN05216278_2134 [Halopelagius longus]
MPELSTENTNAFAHRIAGDTLVYDCPDCEYGEVVITELIESDTSRCLDCGTPFRLYVERADEGGDA